MSGEDLQNVINFGFSLNNVSPFFNLNNGCFCQFTKKTKIKSFCRKSYQFI